jgi:branched-chain amino acid transport system substrate-binding protein
MTNDEVRHPRRAAAWAKGLVFGLILLLVAAGCGASGPAPALPPTRPAWASGAIRVAVLTPMTGELATFGKTVRNGITMAFDDWNDRNGNAGGRSIAWVLEDTRCDPETARQAAERVIAEQGVQAIVGGVCSEDAIPVARVAGERGVLFVAATATHPLVTVDDAGATRPLAFRAAFAYPYQGQAAARLALEQLGARRAAVLTNPGDDFVRSLAGTFATAFVAGGGQVVATATYTSPDADFGALVAEAARADPEVLYVPDAYPVANRVGSQVRTQGLHATLIGSEWWDNGELDLKALEGAYFTLHYRREIPGSTANDWAKRYLAAFSLEPDTLSALGYDAASLLASAIGQAATTAPGDVARALEGMEFDGVTGRWRFDAQHNPLKPVVVVQIKEGNAAFYGQVGP